MRSSIATALEALDTGSEMETEYGFFVLLSTEALTDLLHKLTVVGNCSWESIIEVALPHKVPYNGVKSRLRLCRKSNMEEYCELTTKVTKDKLTKEEFNDRINIVNFQSLACGGKSVVARKRFISPIVDGEYQNYVRKNGKPLAWEIDIYLDGTSKETFDGRYPHCWVKFDLEVDAPIENVIDFLPIKGERVIPANTVGAEDRDLVDKLYSSGYPLTPYIGLEFWDDVDKIMSLVDF